MEQRRGGPGVGGKENPVPLEEPQGELWRARGSPEVVHVPPERPILQGPGAPDCLGRAKGCPQRVPIRRGNTWGLSSPQSREALGEGISDPEDLSWERWCCKPLCLLLLVCA